MRFHTFFGMILIASLLAACAGTQAPPAPATTAPTLVATQPPATATPLPATATPIPEPTTTLSPTPSAPRGTLSFARQLGFGTGPWLSYSTLQLSADQKRLIAVTTAGIFVFSADDLSLLTSIYTPINLLAYPYHRGMRISRDGTLAAGFFFNDAAQTSLKLWDLSTGQLLTEAPLEVEIPNDSLSLVDFDFSPDNQQLAAVSENGTILVLHLPDGKVEKVLEQYVNNTQTPLWLEFDPIGKNAYYIFQDVSMTGVQSYGLNSTSWEEVSFADADTSDFPWETGAFVPLLTKPAGYRYGYFTRPGSRSLEAWEYSTFGKRFEIRRQDPISALAVSSDGQWVAMSGIDPLQVEIWAAETIKAPAQTFPVAQRVWALAVASGGQTVYGITSAGSLAKWISGSPEPSQQVQGFLPVASRLAFTEDGQGLKLSPGDYTGSNEIYTLNLQDGTLQGISPNPDVLDEMKGKVPVSITISPDKKLSAVVYFSLDDYAIRLFDLTTGKFLRKIPSKHKLETIAFSPDGQSLLTFGRKQPIQKLDLETGKVLAEIPVSAKLGGQLVEMYLSRDKSTLALLGESGAIEIYRADTLELRQSLEGDPNLGWLTLADDGSLLAYYTYAGQLHTWDLTNPHPLAPVQLDLPDLGLQNPGLAFSPDNRLLALSSWDGLIRLYNVAP